jgi:hypothetical protein
MNKQLLLAALVTILLYSCINSSHKKIEPDISSIVAEKYSIALKESWDSINATKKIIQNGDLICRTGFDYISKSLQSFNNTDKSYSHSGLAFIEDGKIMIYHSIAGQDENPDECFKKEPLDSFVNPEKKMCFGIFRYKLQSNEANCIYETFKDLERRKVKFDKYFNLQDDEKQYCSEAIYKALLKCTNGRIKIPTTVREKMHIKTGGYEKLEGKRFEYIALDNLYLNPFCDSIKKITYTIGYAKPIR